MQCNIKCSLKNVYRNDSYTEFRRLYHHLMLMMSTPNGGELLHIHIRFCKGFVGLTYRMPRHCGPIIFRSGLFPWSGWRARASVYVTRCQFTVGLFNSASWPIGYGSENNVNSHQSSFWHSNVYQNDGPVFVKATARHSRTTPHKNKLQTHCGLTLP